MEPVRILHMIGSLNIGGSQTMIMNIYRNIDREKIQFDFVLDEPDETYFAKEIEFLGGKIFVMPKLKNVNIREVRRAWAMFWKEHPEYRVLHSHVRSYASIYLPVARKYGIRTIIHSHSISNGKGIQAIVKSVLQYPLRYCADYFFSCSLEAGKWLYGKKIVNKREHIIMKNAIDTRKYLFNPEVRNRVRRELNIEDKIAYIHVGRFHPAKNHMFLLEIFCEIYKRQRESILILIGDGELKDQIIKKIEELDIQENVLLLGNRDDVNELLQGSDCFLFPSLWEGLGVAAIEAQAADLPCVLSEGIPKDVALSDRCIFVSLDNKDAWIENALNIEFSRNDTFQKIEKAGYDILSTAEQLQKFYIEISQIS